MTKYIYAGLSCETLEELETAISNFKNVLDNSPTQWVVVKEVVPNGSGGWVVSPDPLTDEQINSMSADKYYNVNSVLGGDTDIGLTGTEATAKVLEHRTVYAQDNNANLIIETYAPTNEDMSGYV